MSFATAINCMDGRVQEPVSGYLKNKYNVKYVDMVTEPGPNRILAEGSDENTVNSIKTRVNLSVKKHGSKVKTFGVPATRVAEELGRKIVLNIVMLGFFGAVSGILPKEALRKGVETSVPAGTEELNLKAFDKGFEYGLSLKKEAIATA